MLVAVPFALFVAFMSYFAVAQYERAAFSCIRRLSYVAEPGLR